MNSSPVAPTGHLPHAVLGAGPAGLAAAWEWCGRGLRPTVFEKSALVGGIARTEVHRGYRFDIGGHRFYSKNPAVVRLWQEMLGDDLREVQRLSRIHYRGRYYPYPLRLLPTFRNLGPARSALILASYLRWKLFPHAREDTFEHYVTNRFGHELFETFFRSYTEKVWGIRCDEISADWGAQRIQGLSLLTAALGAFKGGGALRSQTSRFYYPRLGPGMMWSRFAERIAAAGGEVARETEVLALRHDGDRVTALEVRGPAGPRTLTVDHCISSLPLPHLIARLDPPPPPAVLTAARSLRFRDFILVGLIVRRAQLFPDQWLYIHTPDFQVGRIQNFGNWSPALVPDPGHSSLGMEYFCSRDDALWQRSDADLIALATREAVGLRLAAPGDIVDAIVIRQPGAYPVYDHDYRAHVQTIRGYLERFRNLATVGRNGLHRYNNQDHSMLSGQRAAQNLFGAGFDLWGVNPDEDYLEVGLYRES